MDVSKVAMTAMLKVVGGLDNLRIVGEGMKSVPTLFGATKYMTADQSAFFPFPTTLKVGWDGGLPEVKGE
jgi:linoleate 8R-lipoxygenase/9,12-octadecadienoate 8-hydroperoxide 8R-isomerase